MTKTKKPTVRPTLVDVAAEAGVSAITVSRTLRQPDLVSDLMRNKVLAAVDKLGYAPDVAASALASRQTNIVGLLVPSFSNNVFYEVIAGAYDAIEKTRYSIQIGNFHYSPTSEEKLIATFARQKPAGLILSGIDQSELSRDMLLGAPFPIVQIMDICEDPIDMIVGFSNSDAAASGVLHMIEQGYRRIGFIGARMDPRSQKRLVGYRNVMEERGQFDPALIVTTPKPSTVAIGAQLFSDLIARAPDCDAVICNNDDLATGVNFECQRRNISVPGEFGICGFNDLGTTSEMVPRVTSVFTPRYQIGAKAIGLLIQAIENHDRETPKIMDLGFDLRVRQSTCRLDELAGRN